MRTVLSSTAVLTCLYLALADAVISYSRPLKYINASGFTPLDQNPLVSKLPEFLRSNDNPDILILGSSLTLYPAVRCDDDMAGRRTRYDFEYRRNYINSYDKANFLERLLSNRLHKKVTIRNLGVIAGVLSDHALILEKAIDSGKRPKLVICCIAPRDFLSNSNKDVESTPVYKVLAGLDNLQNMSLRGASLSEITGHGLESIWHYYQVRADYRTVALAVVAQYLDRPISLYNATQKALTTDADQSEPRNQFMVTAAKLPNRPIYIEPANTLPDLAFYKLNYLPVNQLRFNTQSEYLRRLLTLCERTHLALLIVNMPLTRENKAILPQAVLNQYKETLITEIKKSRSTFFDADTNDYQLTDFEDSCHLNKRGGAKFYNSLANKLSNRNKIADLGISLK